MRSRDRILSNLEQIYRESYDRARTGGDELRMVDIRDLFAVTPAAPASSNKTALEQLEALRRLARR